MSDLSEFLYELRKVELPTCLHCHSKAHRSLFDYLVCKEHDHAQEHIGKGFLEILWQLVFAFSCSTCGAYFRISDKEVTTYGHPGPCENCKPVHTIALALLKLTQKNPG